MMLKGMTAQYLIRQTYPVKAGDTILIHAAAGGVGLIVCQWAKHLGATVIGTVGSDEKAKLAKAHGCDHTIVYTRENFVEARQRDHRRQEGAGGLRFRRQGHLPGIARLPGAARHRWRCSATPPAASSRSTSACCAKGSLYVTRPTLMTYTAKRDDLVATANELFDVVKSGKVKIEVNQTYPLKDAAQAHLDLEARKTTGSTVLTV